MTPQEQDRQETIRARLQLLSERAGGRITPDAVINDAKRPASPLHSEFQWNLDKAAHEHWLYTARKLIQSVRFTVTEEHRQVSVPLYVRDPSADREEQGYVSILDLKRDNEGARKALLREFGRADAYLERARDIATALSLDAAVDEIRGNLRTLTEKVESIETPELVAAVA